MAPNAIAEKLQPTSKVRKRSLICKEKRQPGRPYHTLSETERWLIISLRYGGLDDFTNPVRSSG